MPVANAAFTNPSNSPVHGYRATALTGKRTQATVSTFPAPSTYASSNNRVTPTAAGFKGRRAVTLVGIRSSSVKGYVPTTVLGNAVPTASLDPNRKYKMITKYMPGKRTEAAKLDKKYHEFHNLRGDRTENTNQGMGTWGVLYQPASTPTTEKKPIRRWPRDWHGDNMN